MIKQLFRAWQGKKERMLFAYLDTKDDLDPSAPINKLMTAILESAIEKQAEAVRLVTKINRGALQGPPSPNDIEERLATAQRIGRSLTAEEVAAKTFHYRDTDKQNDDLIIDFRYAGTWHEEMSIPQSLLKPLIRHLRYRFNLDHCTSLDKPSKTTQHAGTSFALETYAPEGNILAVFHCKRVVESSC